MLFDLTYKGSLVDEGSGIGIEEEDGKGEYEAMTDQSEQVVLHELEQDPDCGGPTKDHSRCLLVPPQEYISSCKP